VSFDPSVAVRFGLVLGRVAGMMAVAPIAWEESPAKARAALAILCAVVVTPTIPHTELSLESGITAAPMEILLGVAMGMVPRMLMSVSHMVGDLLTPLFGLNGQLLFGGRGEGESSLGRLVRMLVAVLALGLGVHRVILASTLQSFEVLPPGSPMNVGLAVGPLAEVARAVLVLGVRMSMPIVAVHLAMQTALAFISRAAPSMQVFSVGFAASIIMGFLTLLVLLPDEAIEVTRTLADTGPAIEHVLLAVTGR
jgi:flagellar biosynthetic protein FliR